jgi:hypothetical protein
LRSSRGVEHFLSAVPEGHVAHHYAPTERAGEGERFGMNVRKKRPSPAFVVAMVALFVALGGTAGAVVTAAVPLAKRALVADNAKKLDGQTPSQLVSQASAAPGPASTAAGLISIKIGSWSLGPNGGSDFLVTCDSGQKAVAGGWDDPAGWAHSWDDRPTADGTGWRVYISTSQNAPGPQTGGLYAVCLR